MRCNDALSITDLTFNFMLTCRSPALSSNYYSEYQLFLYQTISEHREQGMTFDAIAEWLNKEGYLTVRGKKFRGAHVHSILKKRLAKEELLTESIHQCGRISAWRWWIRLWLICLRDYNLRKVQQPL